MPGNEKHDTPFAWGVATAAYQIEGGWNAGGKGQSIWDTFTRRKGKIYLGQNADVACDFYHHYASDIALLHKLQIPNFRFSISWPRLLPSGIGHINQPGIDFYNRVIDFCLELDIRPWVTLYHWDLPQALEMRGGWTNREVLSWFAEYVQLCVKHFGDRVKNWMVLNEPVAFTGAGYFMGIHAPGRKGLGSFLPAVHHAALCQAEGGRILRSWNSDYKVGTTFSSSHVEPLTQRDKDIQAAQRVDALLNRTFIEPLAGLGYPVADLKVLTRLDNFIKDGDEARLAFAMDFIGVQNYTREIVQHSWFVPFLNAKIVQAVARKVQVTDMYWEVFPPAIYNVLHRLNKYGFKELIVTENGAAFKDVVHDGQVNDEQRRVYLQQHIEQVLKARSEGVKVNGYFVWILLDNFEWAEGYRPRFGLVHVDFKTQKRTIKSSAYWYSKFICNHATSARLQYSG